MNFDIVENLTNEQVNLLYEDVIDNELQYISSTVLEWYCSGYCKCPDEGNRFGTGYHYEDISGNSYYNYTSNPGLLCVATNNKNILPACTRNIPSGYRFYEYFTSCTPYEN